MVRHYMSESRTRGKTRCRWRTRFSKLKCLRSAMTFASCARLGLGRPVACSLPLPAHIATRRYGSSLAGRALRSAFEALEQGLPWSRTPRSARRAFFSSSVPFASRSTIIPQLKEGIFRATHRDYRPDSQSFEQRLRASGRSGGGGRFDQLPQGFIFWPIVVANGVVFLAWQMAKARYVSCHSTYVALIVHGCMVMVLAN
jgi:hypothetical protein